MNQFLPLHRSDMLERDWHYLDFICITGDSYVDHPSFGVAVISRVIEAEGFKVGIISQPQTDEDYREFGTPRYGFLITAGNIDSMVSHYTTAKRKRSNDPYTAGGKAGKRPDRALTVYSKAVRRLFPATPLLLGGLEASFRRFAHYDYWADAVHPSVLLESGADLLMYGMGEHAVREITHRLAKGEAVSSITNVRGTCVLMQQHELPQNAVVCPSLHKITADKAAFARAYQQQIEEQDAVYGKVIVQKQDYMNYLVQNPPQPPLTTNELDAVFRLPYQRMYHPYYEALGGVDAIQEVEFSIMHNRGCFGGCNFCAITFHQGRVVTSRSKESVVEEARQMVKNPRFKGYIHDVGGPTANFRQSSCTHQLTHGVCKHKQCLTPKPCRNLVVDHGEYLAILQEIRNIKGIKKVFVRSGIRYDYLVLDKDPTFLNELVEHHVSGQLKVAPEHSCPHVLGYMGKPTIETFDKFRDLFYKTTRTMGKEQYLVPYLMSSHPGATLQDAVELAVYLKKNRLRPEQVQDFYPTPGTASTAMFYSGIEPATGKPVYVAKTEHEKAMQRALLQFFDKRNHDLVRRALHELGREDLIGTAPHCLVPPGGKQTTEARHVALPKEQKHRRAHHGKPRNKKKTT